jgi:hypothetical protein
MSNLPNQSKKPTAKPAIEQLAKNAYWMMWLTVTAMTWIPLILVVLIRKEPWHIILVVLAILWLMSTTKTVSRGPVTKYFMPPLLLGGIGIAMLGFLNPSGLFSLILIFIVVIIFMSTPNYVFKSRNDELKQK